VGGAKLQERSAVWYAAALAGPAWFLSLRELFENRFGDRAIGLLPVALAALSLVAAQRLRGLWEEGDARRLRGLVWFSAVALGFSSVAIPLQLEKEWITVGWALEGWALIALWRRLDHPGLKYFSLFLFAAVTVRLLCNPALLEYHEASELPILNWLAYTYLVPAAALLLAAKGLAALEVARRREWERRWYAGPHPLGAGALAAVAIVVVFAWINLTLFDAFASGGQLELGFERSQARDLSLSIAWILYALVLGVIAIVRRSAVLRWVSLAGLGISLGKVALWDMAALEGLYRVAAWAGVALAFTLVSLGYSRFVPRRAREEK
jgi:uncharacterized membrane protein